MPVKPSTSERSVTSTARRAQIIAATVGLIAEEGYAQASFGRIADRAGLSSTRLISYHFAGKDDLIAACVEHVVSAIGSSVGGRVSSQTSAPAMLRAYIESVVEFTDAHRSDMRALLQILLSGGWVTDPADAPAAADQVEKILRQGQADGHFRGFDPHVMALTIQRAVEALPFALETDPGLDCAAYGRELVATFELATRREPR